MATILITGAEHPVAANLAVVLARAFDVVAVEDRRASAQQAAKTLMGPLAGCQNSQSASTAELVDLIHGIGPDAVIHCGSLCGDAWSPMHFDADLESAEICSLAQATCHVDGHFSLISSDAIFDRPRLFHNEQSTSLSKQGLWMRGLESAALEWGGLVLRSHPLAWGGGSNTFSWQFHNAVMEQRSIAINPACHATPVLVDEFAEGWVRAFDRRLRGLLHLGGMERVGQLGFARRLALSLNEPVTLEHLFELSYDHPQQKETSLCSRQARDLLGWHPSTLGDTISEFAGQRHSSRWEALGLTMVQPVSARRVSARAA